VFQLPPPPQPVKLPDEKTGGKSLEEAEARLPPTIPYYSKRKGSIIFCLLLHASKL